jgi:2-hydroxychromene-2-carboxylate isomerase
MGMLWYFDFISPFAYLQWQRLKPLRDELGLQPVPILFAAVLDHHGHKGPAEIAAKRRFSYRFVQFEAERRGVPFAFPAAHPFNPITALRLAVALEARNEVIDAIFAQVWGEGGSTDDFSAIAAQFGVADVSAAISVPGVKAKLRDNTDAAIARGVFGVPTLAIGDALFWGDDATAMALAFRSDRELFAHGDYPRIDALPAAVQRKAAG